MSTNKIKVVGYAQKVFYNDGIEYRNFSPDLVGNQLTSNGGTPLFTMGNFAITTNMDSKLNKNFITNRFSNFVTLSDLNLTLEQTQILLDDNANVILNLDKTKLNYYALFGSLTEFVRVSLENIITTWPASLYIIPISQTSTGQILNGYTFENYSFNSVSEISTFKIDTNFINNKFQINFLTNGNILDTFNASNNMRNLTVNYQSYVIYVNGQEYPVINFTGATYVKNDYIYFEVQGNPFSGLGTSSKIVYHIKPSKLESDKFFNSLPDFEFYLLNRQVTPRYSATFKYPIKSETGIILYIQDTVTWPVTDGYNLDFDTTEYVDYASKLLEIATDNDLYSSDLMNRFLVAESISAFDTTPVHLSDQDQDTTGQKINKTLHIYGRSFDDINKFITGIEFANVVTYDKLDNTPDAYLKNLARVLGWELISSVVENDLLNNYVTTAPTSYSGQSVGYTAVEADIELWRRLILNTPWIWKSKGTRKSIEFLLNFIGAPQGLVDFNEYIYKANGPINVDFFKQILESHGLDSNDLSVYPIDNDGYPNPLANTQDMYFQNNGLWYRETGGTGSTIDILVGNNPHSGPYDGGYKYINQFRSLIPNFSAVTISSSTFSNNNTNLFTNYNLGVISNYSGLTYVDVTDDNGNPIDDCVTIESSIIPDPMPSDFITNCGCQSAEDDDSLSICVNINEESSQDCSDGLKLILNPKGNDGVTFYVDDNETCNLSIDFKYLFKVNCETLNNFITENIINAFVLSDNSANFAIKNQIQEQETICDSYTYELEGLIREIAATPYSIECVFQQDNIEQVPITSDLIKSFSNTAFNKNNTIAPFSLYFANGVGTFCLNEPQGLYQWQQQLGPVRYQQFIDGDPNSYTCSDVQTIVDYNASVVLNGGEPIISECNIPFGTKTELLKQYVNVLNEKALCESSIAEMQKQISVFATQQDAQQSISQCSSPIDFFESFDVSIAIETITSANTFETVYQQSLFTPIGSGNLYSYLTANTNSGFYVCGDPNDVETSFNGCSPMFFDFEDVNVNNVTACETVMTNILYGLFAQSGLSGLTDGAAIFQNSLSYSALSSNWLHFNTEITDPNIINQIINQKIKISFKINNACGNFCLLIDEISLNRNCNRVENTELFISQPIGFDLERIKDNKKSWLSKTSPVNRVFDIKNSLATNNIRQTNYNINDERLIINTKEIDLDIKIASGVESDVWSYISNNLCILSGTCSPLISGDCCNPCIDVTGDTCGYKQFQDDTCFEFMDSQPYEFMDGEFSGNTNFILSNCCGDAIDFNEILTQPFSAFTNVEDFKYFLTSELIDAKNRQTISSYPTLKALYERYINSINYCNVNSSAFNYMSMSEFANLIDNYWVDIIEQTIPATTIWGSVKVYSNTIFDQQKFKYKSYSTLLCGNPYNGMTISNPINGDVGKFVNVGVNSTMINLNINDDIKLKTPVNSCDILSVAQMNMGSEFIGTVNVITNQ